MSGEIVTGGRDNLDDFAAELEVAAGQIRAGTVTGLSAVLTEDGPWRVAKVGRTPPTFDTTDEDPTDPGGRNP